MRLAAIATVVFVAGLSPGLFRSEGPVRDTPPRVHRAAMAKPPHAVLVRVADLLRIRF